MTLCLWRRSLGSVLNNDSKRTQEVAVVSYFYDPVPESESRDGEKFWKLPKPSVNITYHQPEIRARDYAVNNMNLEVWYEIKAYT